MADSSLQGSSKKQVAAILEPDSGQAYIMATYIKRHNFEVIREESINDLINLLSGNSIAIILVAEEIRNANYTGIDICKAFIHTFKGRIPVVLMTQNPTKDLIKKVTRVGVKDIIVKPVSETNLMKKIRKTIDQDSNAYVVPENIKELNFKQDMTPFEMIEVVIEEADEIRALPHIVQKVIKVAQNDKAGIAQMEQAINSDPAAVAITMKHANSAYYKGQQRITHLKDAIIRIGFDACRKMVIGLTVLQTFDRYSKSFGFNRLQYWLHSIITAVIAEGLSGRVDPKNTSHAFIAGLLHDVGKVFLDDYLPTQFQQMLQRASANTLSMYQAELEIFERTHNSVSKGVLEKWKFPQVICEAVLHHHTAPILPKDKKVKLGLNEIVFLANKMAKATLLGTGGDTLISPVPNFLWEKFEFNDGLFEEQKLYKLYSSVNEFIDFLNISKKEIGYPVELVKKNKYILFIYDKQTDYLSIILFLQCQGYDVFPIPLGSSVPTGQNPYKILIQVKNKEGLDDALSALKISLPLLPAICIMKKHSRLSGAHYKKINLLPEILTYQSLKLILEQGKKK